MAAHIPQLPSSIGPVMLAVQAVAFTFAYVAPQIKAVQGANAAANRIQATSVRALGEFRLLTEMIEQVDGIPAALNDEDRPHLDRIADARTTAYAVRDTLHRALRAADEMTSAVAAGRKYDQILAFANRDWRKMAREVDDAVKVLRAQVESSNVFVLLDDAIRSIDELFAQGHQMTAAGELPPHIEHSEARAVASEGFNSWLAGLPDDDWSDAADSVAPLRWLEGEGWVER